MTATKYKLQTARELAEGFYSCVFQEYDYFNNTKEFCLTKEDFKKADQPFLIEPAFTLQQLEEMEARTRATEFGQWYWSYEGVN